jgi:hypothetical protein
MHGTLVQKQQADVLVEELSGGQQQDLHDYYVATDSGAHAHAHILPSPPRVLIVEMQAHAHEVASMTLQYATRARQIQNKTGINMDSSGTSKIQIVRCCMDLSSGLIYSSQAYADFERLKRQLVQRSLDFERLQAQQQVRSPILCNKFDVIPWQLSTADKTHLEEQLSKLRVDNEVSPLE